MSRLFAARDSESAKKFLMSATLLICLSSFGCRDSATNRRVDFVGRSAVYGGGKKPNPLRLVIGVGADKRLRLNKIETGTLSDPAELTEKLRIVFEDRKKASIFEREVIIDAPGEIEDGELEKLIRHLADAGAAPILLVAEKPPESIPTGKE